jgi:group I intron endonuclease
MRYGSVYVVTNTVTQEQYVGQTRQKIQRRWNCHVNTANSSVAKKYLLAQAIQQYGRDAFAVEEAFVAFDADALNNAEIACIAELSPVYNITKGGAGHRVVKAAESVRQARSERMKRQWADPAWRSKQVAKLKIVCGTPEAAERGKAVQKLGTQARWANHVKREKPGPKQKASKHRRPPEIGRMMAARAKWKPVYCPELQCSFFSQKAAAEYLGVLTTSITNAIKRQGKVAHAYTLVKVV